MARRDWSKAAPQKPGESVRGGDLMPSVPRPRTPKAQVRSETERLVREFQAKRTNQGK